MLFSCSFVCVCTGDSFGPMNSKKKLLDYKWIRIFKFKLIPIWILQNNVKEIGTGIFFRKSKIPVQYLNRKYCGINIVNQGKDNVQ